MTAAVVLAGGLRTRATAVRADLAMNRLMYGTIWSAQLCSAGGRRVSTPAAQFDPKRTLTSLYDPEPRR